MKRRRLWIMVHAMLVPAGQEDAPCYAVGPFAGLEEMQAHHEEHPCDCELYPLPLYSSDDTTVIIVDPAKDRVRNVS